MTKEELKIQLPTLPLNSCFKQCLGMPIHTRKLTLQKSASRSFVETEDSCSSHAAADINKQLLKIQLLYSHKLLSSKCHGHLYIITLAVVQHKTCCIGKRLFSKLEKFTKAVATCNKIQLFWILFGTGVVRISAGDDTALVISRPQVINAQSLQNNDYQQTYLEFPNSVLFRCSSFSLSQC